MNKQEIDLGEVGLPGNTSVGNVAGQFLFLGTITPHYLPSGRLITALSQLPKEARRSETGNMLVDIQEERAMAQAWTIYNNLAQLLKQNGSSFSNLLRQRLFLSDLQDLAAVERVMDLFLTDNKPATTIVQVPTQGTNPQIAFQMDCIALVRKRGGFNKEIIHTPGLETVCGRYPHGTRAGQFVFVSNVVGVNPKTGKLAATLSELGDEIHHFEDYRCYNAKEEAILTQSWFIFHNISRILISQGASLGDILKVNGWLGITMREFKPALSVRRAFFHDRDAMPASASIGISGLAKDGALLGYDCIALVPPRTGKGYHKEVHSEPSALVPIYVLSAQGGPLAFTCGEVPIDVTIPKVIRSFEDLDDEGKLLPFARMHIDTPIQAKAWFVYKKIDSYLAEHGASFADVVHQTVFMHDPADYPALERVATLFFGPKVPPTSVIPITDTSPYQEAKLELEVIAAVPG